MESSEIKIHISKIQLIYLRVNRNEICFQVVHQVESLRNHDLLNEIWTFDNIYFKQFSLAKVHNMNIKNDSISSYSVKSTKLSVSNAMYN